MYVLFLMVMVLTACCIVYVEILHNKNETINSADNLMFRVMCGSPYDLNYTTRHVVLFFCKIRTVYGVMKYNNIKLEGILLISNVGCN